MPSVIRAFVVGHPIAHSRSPLIHRHWLGAYGILGSYEPIDVPPDSFGDFMRALPRSGFVGGNVTLPHKAMAFAMVDERTPRAEAIGAVNTLVVKDDGRILGDNTDAPGFRAHLDQSLGPDWSQRTGGSAVVLGAGGAARAIVVGLAERGVTRIRVANRTWSHAASVAALAPGIGEPLAWDELPAALQDAGLLVNTTSLGMKGQPPLALDLAPLPRHAAVADIVYAPLETCLLTDARERGLATVDGLGMLLHQAVPGFEAWFGPRPSVTEALRATIVADLAAR